MKEYNCVWCGCELENKDDVCFKHASQLKVLKCHIQAALNDDKRERELYQKGVLIDSMILSKKIKDQIQSENALKEAEQKLNVMSDDDQQQIFRALGIAV